MCTIEIVSTLVAEPDKELLLGPKSEHGLSQVVGLK